MPGIGRGNGDELGPGSRTINADAFGVRAQVTATSETISTMPAGDVTFADDEIALSKTTHIRSGPCNFPDEFVTNRHRHWDRFLRPGIPIINVNIGTADRRLFRADQNIVGPNLRHRNLFQPQTGLGFGFHDCWHHSLHCDPKPRRIRLRGKQESMTEEEWLWTISFIVPMMKFDARDNRDTRNPNQTGYAARRFHSAIQQHHRPLDGSVADCVFRI